VADQAAGELSDESVEGARCASIRAKRAGPVEFGRRIPAGVEFVQMPAQSSDDAGALGNQVFTVIDQQPDLPSGTVEPGHRKVWFTQGGAGDRQRIDRVGLAVVRALVRTFATSLGGTRTTCSPAAIRSRSSRRLRCRQSSIAHVRSAAWAVAHRSNAR
jgi:hypothetical protein